MNRNILGIIMLFFLVTVITGCCNRKKVKQHKNMKKMSPIMKLYQQEIPDDKMLKSGDYTFFNWEKIKNMYLYSPRKTTIKNNYYRKQAEKNKYFKNALKYVFESDFKKAIFEMKKAKNSLTNNKYVDKMMKKIQIRYLQNKTFENEDIKNSANSLINGNYRKAQMLTNKIIRNPKNAKNIFLLREAYKIKYTSESLDNNRKASATSFRNFNYLSRKIRKKYYE